MSLRNALFRLRRVNLAPVEIRRGHLRIVQIEDIDREDIAIEHDEIAALAGLKAAGRVFLFQCRGSVDRIGIDHVLKRQTLVR
jgi:hypothetical protein